MTRGIETKVTVQIKPNKKDLSSDDLFEFIFYRARTGKAGIAKHHAESAKKIVLMAAKKPHINDSDYPKICEELGIALSDYNQIVGKLRDVGFLKKDGHIIRASRRFSRFLREMGRTSQNFCDDMGLADDE